MPKPITYKNKTYDSVKELAKEYNINYWALTARLRRGKSIEDAINKPVTSGKQITYKNKTYDSMAELAKEYNIPLGILYGRLNKYKWSLERSLTTPVTKGSHIVIHDHLGNTFNSIAKLCRHYNIPEGTFQGRYRRGWDIEKILTTPIHKKGICDHFGKKFSSIKEMCEFYGITLSQFYRGKQKGETLSEILCNEKEIDTIEDIDLIPDNPDIIHELCGHCKISQIKYNERLDEGWSIDDALNAH